MDTKKLVADVQEILAANGDFSNLSDKEVYAPSIQVERKNVYFILHENGEKYLVACESGNTIGEFDAIATEDAGNGKALVVAELTQANNEALSYRFPWVKPISRHGYKYTFGLGDRLGSASNAHLRLFKGRGIFPILAQQSIRELLLTDRTELDVVQSASWAVFEEGYTDGWGADGDHVKEPYEVEYAVESGCTMITLDATKKIHNEIADLSDEELDAKYNALDPEFVTRFNNDYLDKTFKIGENAEVHFDKKDVEQSVLIYFDAVEYATYIYHRFVVPNNLDFEISMDETIVPTTPANHYFFANELKNNNITPETLAPKFYGEFQKAIDYIGDLGRFEREYVVHEAIAEKFGYRLSIHSGSDKLSVYPIIGRLSKKNGWHVKTAGTNWLEALRVVAKEDPKLMQEIYKYSFDNLDDVKPFYVFHADQTNSPKPSEINDSNVMSLLTDDNPRQILHTMYGNVLNYQESFKYVYRDRFFDLLKKHQDEYDDFLNRHIAEHIDLLQGKAATKEEVQSKYEPKN
ncbi:tagaturonate epimerase family protein [Paucilactobacillus kaifaensis]|uniref:tagaturonate epimerase family protein n=1 Tax=Paucilactobacillus kaifaensis TaxID=2559921 RepID=UPI0010F994A2|nr:tagaturonate epimerase family protein [Paucilactobacillus kaifaensis]